ncbi:hypothetical protein M3J09_005389 [Ascochyta lentis]
MRLAYSQSSVCCQPRQILAVCRRALKKLELTTSIPVSSTLTTAKMWERKTTPQDDLSGYTTPSCYVMRRICYHSVYLPAVPCHSRCHLAEVRQC